MSRAIAWLEAQSLFVAGVATVAAMSLAKLPEHLNQDGWLALVSGRYVAAQGIPHHDVLNVVTHGARWIDQQWLAQLAMYGLYQLGGLVLYGFFYVALTVAGLGLAIAAARRLGASERHVVWVLPAAAFLYFAGSFQIRTQGFAYPLFVAVLWLLAAEVRSPTRRRVYLVFPLLVLWGNMHGSVTLGVMLATVYGMTLLVHDVRAGGRWRNWRRAVRSRSIVFALLPALCLLATPYGVSIVSYYQQTLFNPTFGRVVTEWQPVTSVLLLAVPFFLLAFGAVWLLGRSGSRTPIFDHVTLLVLAVAAVFAIRNITWFALATVMLLPCAISGAVTSHPAAARRPTLNLALVGVAITVLLGSVISVLAKPSSWFEHGYDHRTVSTVADIVQRQPATRIYADNRFSDWLVWHDPSLAGRIAYDVRFELLTQRQLSQLADITQVRGPRDPDVLAPYSLLVLDPTNQPTTRLLLDRSGTRVILRGKRTVVAAR